MAKKPGGGDGYGYDPERAAVRDMFDGLERRAADRPDKPARQIGEVLKIPKITATQKRLLNTNAAILDGLAKDFTFQHTVFCQVGLPYRPTDLRVWEREQGNVSLRIEAGAVRDVKAGRWVDLPLPHGEKPRLILIHLNGEALRTGSPVIDVQDSMTAFVRSLGVDTNGRNLRTLKDQLGRLAAATIRLAAVEDGRAVQINGQVIGAFDLWFPSDPGQHVLWPTMVRLSADYFDSLTRHAVPLDHRAVAALAHAAMALDAYTWLAQRLHRIAKGKPQRITWTALKGQFGGQYDRMDHFREEFKRMLRQVLTVYPGADVGEWIESGRSVGLILCHSKPPVAKRMVMVPRLEPQTIDGAAIEVTKKPGDD